LHKEMKQRAQEDGEMLNFIGAGAYEHHIPAAVWQVATRGEFYSAYTPYQAEASQGSLQLIYEYQTMMASLLAMEVSNASLYDGATSFAEAILMAARLTHHDHKTHILVPRALSPFYRQTAETIVKQQNITLVEIPYQPATGQIDRAKLEALDQSQVAAIVIAQANFFGVVEDVDALTNWAAEKQILTIAVVNPLAIALLKPPGLAIALLKPPGQWGNQGVDIACGEGQPLGIPLAGGGPYFGFMCCRKRHVRQMPGRLVGETIDSEGKPGYVLTLQAREQHIRRAKATSNICTNQGLMVTAATIYMSILGPLGLRQVAMASHHNTKLLQKALLTIDGVQVVFAAPFFHEIVIRLPAPAFEVVHALAQERIQLGYLLEQQYPELKNCVLLCATETKLIADIHRLTHHLAICLAKKKVKNKEEMAWQI
jgi:glycine dehydrogenase subunit 1